MFSGGDSSLFSFSHDPVVNFSSSNPLSFLSFTLHSVVTWVSGVGLAMMILHLRSFLLDFASSSLLLHSAPQSSQRHGANHPRILPLLITTTTTRLPGIRLHAYTSPSRVSVQFLLRSNDATATAIQEHIRRVSACVILSLGRTTFSPSPASIEVMDECDHHIPLPLSDLLEP